MNTTDILAAALRYVAAGLSCIPVTLPSKGPFSSLLPHGKHGPTWEPYMTTIATDTMIRKWFERPGVALALVCGTVSGGLEILDFDNKGSPNAIDLYSQWVALVEPIAPGLVNRLPLEKSLSGGYHIFYRCSEIEGSQKLAQRRPTPDELTRESTIKVVTLIETRGERHTKDGARHSSYCIVSPTPGYTLLGGDLTAIPIITNQERAVLIRAARVLSSYVHERQIVSAPRTSTNEAGLRPGDDYNTRATPHEVAVMLERAGWHRSTWRADGTSTWLRPGKTQGNCSATLGYVAPNVFYVFSTNAAPFEAEHGYKPFELYTFLEHNGDFPAAARALKQQGYGEQNTYKIPSKNAPNVISASQSANSANSANAIPVSEPWQPPIPFNDYHLPTFPTSTLTPWLREFVESVSQGTQTPSDLAALLALAVLATTCQKKVDIIIRENWREPLNLFTLITLPSGNRKSVVFTEMTTPLFDWERAEAVRMSPEIAAAQVNFKIIEERLHHAQMEAAKGTPEQQSKKRDEALKIARELDTLTIPVAPRLIADDITPERLVSLIAEHSGRMSVMSAEGGIFDVMSGRYTNGAPNFDVYLKGHARDVLRVDRHSRKDEFVQSPALTLGLTVQPEVLRGLIRRPGFRGRGLLGRFLYALPASWLGRRMIDPPPVPQAIRAAYHKHISMLLALPFGTDSEGNPVAHTLTLSSAARGRLLDFAKWVEPQLSEWGELGAMTDWGGKLVGAVARIAALLHVATHSTSNALWSVAVESRIVDDAITIGKYLISHARAAYAEMGTDEQLAAARYLLRWIKKWESTSFTKREAFEATKGTFKKVEMMEPALSLLQEHGYIRQQLNLQQSGPGRKSEVYEINPLIASHNPHNSQNDPFQQATKRTDTDTANNANSANTSSAHESHGPEPNCTIDEQVQAMQQASRAYALIACGLFGMAAAIIEQMPDDAIDKARLQAWMVAQSQSPSASASE